MPAAIAVDVLIFDQPHRRCRDCEQTLPLDETHFYNTARGFLQRCRDCERARSRASHRATRENRRSGAGRKFGIEIEFIGGYHQVISEMRARGMTVSYQGYTHRVQGGWKIVTDGSISHGFELVSPPLRGAGGARQVEQACEALAAAGVHVDRSCGLHVHHDIRDLDAVQIGRLARLWSNNQAATNGLVAASRRNSNWAYPLQTDDVVGLENLNPERFSGDIGVAIRSLYLDRYRTLNFNSFPRYGTVEVRQHQGSLNAQKILAWMEFGRAMISFAKGGDAVVTEHTTDALVERLTNHGLAAATATFLKERAAFFAGRRTRVAA